jgi:thioredoxin 1
LEKGGIMSDNIQQISQTNFEQVVLQSNLPVLLDCWAPWCMPCRVQQPILEKVADEFQGKALIVSLNTEEHPDAAYGLNIHSIPTLVIFKDGEERRRLIGLQKAGLLSKVLADAISIDH